LQQDLCAGITSVREAEQISRILQAFTDKSTIRSQDLFRWFVYMIRNRYAREQTWQWMKDSWDWIEQTYGGDKSYSDFPRYAASGLATNSQRTDYKDFFAPKRSQTALTRTIDLGLVEIDGRIELLERDGDEVRTRLRER
jgi:aminopeptidase N